MKRALIGTLFGLIAGLICLLAGIYVFKNTYTDAQVINIFAHRAVTGFVIGTTTITWHWAIRGVFLGSLTGILFLLYEIILGYPMYIVYLLIGVHAIYGLFIDFFTTKVFHTE